jgi:hypothetical protein
VKPCPCLSTSSGGTTTPSAVSTVWLLSWPKPVASDAASFSNFAWSTVDMAYRTMKRHIRTVTMSA